ncbi:PEP-CTERM sorting domain-containing protein [Rugamonas sp. CCM 8940]|uniref:PEP-CTERM sorting domain-containing protein n=1 Tax=Rugamonas sp. CCM 8940 TaxID=2765359 RepID=UPI0018F54F72|nr:PEP-CTERM sorting domain-containing protein [Rugamonas sp. CCM 8940]MBJ7313058.1 PEP-CTERM sorting domain-containing protein [Rugamonas sp. CCM 8940]
MRFTTLTLISRTLAVAGTLVLAAPFAHAAGAGFGANLIVNGDAEAGVGSPSGGLGSTPAWSLSSNFSTVKYGASGGFPSASDAGPANRGLNFFAGGDSNSASRASQVIDLSAYAGAINSGKTQFDLAGWLGGYSSQGDNAVLSATFLDAGGHTLGSASLASVGAAERHNLTGLVARDTQGYIPVGAVSVGIVLDMLRRDGSYNDGYADNLSFAISPVPEPGSWAMLAGGLALLGVAAKRKQRKA